MEHQDCIGFLSYSGSLVEDGLLDARKSAEALLGLDQAIRHFAGEQSPQLKEADYEFPVRIQQSSWDAIIPSNIGDWIMACLGIGAVKYVATAASEMAKKDFKDAGFRDIFRRALEAVQWMIRLGKHLGHLKIRKVENVRWKEDNQVVSVPNSEGEFLDVPREYLELVQTARPDLLKRITQLVEEERQMSVSVVRDGQQFSETVTSKYRTIFTGEETNETDVLFPELQHGQDVSLEGNVTRGNENTNSIGFKYMNHILTCYPKRGSIVEYKSTLFEEAQIHGTVSRSDEYGGINALRPKIIFDKVEALPPSKGQPGLFANGVAGEENE